MPVGWSPLNWRMHIDEIMSQIYEENPKWFPYGLSRDMLNKVWKIMDPTTNEPAGFTGRQVRPNTNGGKTGWYAVGLLPSFRGKGLAQRALSEMFEHHLPEGVNDVKAFIVKGNEKSVALANRLGVPYQHKSARALIPGLRRARLPLNLAGMTKTASPRRPNMVSLQQFMPITNRRQRFTPQEQEQIDSNSSNWFPSVFRSSADSPAVDMHSPSKAALMAALAGGGAGYYGSEMFKASPVTKMLATSGGAILPAIIAYMSTQANNDDVVERMRRIPPDGTRRDVESDPVYQAELNRQAQSGASTEALRTAQMLAALQAVKHANVGKLLGKLKGVATSAGAKNWAYPIAGAGAWDAALNWDQYGEHVPIRGAMGLLNLALLRKGIAKGQLDEAIAMIPTKDLAVQAGLRMPQFADAMSQMGSGAAKPPATTSVNVAPQGGENWLQTLGSSVKDHPWLAAGGLLGTAGLAKYLMSGSSDKAQPTMIAPDQSGRIRVTLPTRRRGDAETTVEMPLNQMELPDTLMRRLQRDTRSRLRTETNERTRKVNLSDEERQRRRDALLARLRPSLL